MVTIKMPSQLANHSGKVKNGINHISHEWTMAWPSGKHHGRNLMFTQFQHHQSASGHDGSYILYVINCLFKMQWLATGI